MAKPNMPNTTQAPEFLPLLTHPLNAPLPIPQSTITKLLSSPPFHPIASLFNFRDLSGLHSYPTAIKPGMAYRCGTLENLSPEGIKALQDLGIKTIFDLRSLVERNTFPTQHIAGIENVWTPSTTDNLTIPGPAADAAATAIATTTTAITETKIKDESKDAETKTHQQTKPFSLTDLNLHILSTHAASFTLILRHIASHPGPFVFHCTAGKDRTGVLAFILQSLAGSSVGSMDVDYSLTRLGLEPSDTREFLTGKLLGSIGMSDATKEDVENVMASEKMRVYNVIPLDAMRRLKKGIEEVYGGVEAMYLGWGGSQSEIEGVRRVLRGEV
jgi:protein tyrosine/serine phosphatase